MLPSIENCDSNYCFGIRVGLLYRLFELSAPDSDANSSMNCNEIFVLSGNISEEKQVMIYPNLPHGMNNSEQYFSEAELIDDDSELESSLKKSNTIHSYGADYTVETLVKRMHNGSFIIPTFQRKFIWSKTHASRFIESLLMRLPVPGLFLCKRSEDGRVLVVDGQQRLRTLHGFYTGIFRDSEFRLAGVRDPWNGLTYEELNPGDQLQLDDSIVHSIIFSQESASDAIDSIQFVFERINSGGIRLSPQEIRNCIAEGEFTDFTAKLNENQNWRHIYGKKSLRAKDQELITRVLAFLEKGENYESPMATFLTEFAFEMNSAKPKKFKILRKTFEKTAELCWEALGPEGFRPVRALNAAVLDAVMSELARCLLRKAEVPTPEAVKRAYEDLIKSEEFRGGWEKATAVEANVKKRIAAARNAFAGI